MAQIGLIGLGTMGAALALNIAEKGFDIAVYNRTAAKTREFHAQAGDLAARVTPTDSLQAFVDSLQVPRAIILMVPAGQPVDDQIAALRPLLDADDLIVDAGNANFHETNRRSATGDPFMGIGVSGGKEGARHGPSIMGGGDRAHWDRIAPILTAIAARHDGTPCATWMGPAGAGHFVKTVHNGIEYADMQMIAETYGIMRDGMGMTAPEIAKVFDRWNGGALRSYLIEISAQIAVTTDPATDRPILDMIVDAAGQKGTGRWTAIAAQDMGASIPAIEAAIMARNLSAAQDDRRQGQARFGAAPQMLKAGTLTIAQLEQALIAGKILCYAQGFDMIHHAARDYDWPLPLPDIARVWRAGCIIRSAMLDDMAQALQDDAGRNLMLAPGFAERLLDTHDSLRQTVATAALHGLACPALGSGLAYFDIMRTARGTANMIQGQRDFFGAHGFTRIDDDRPGQHGPWWQ